MTRITRFGDGQFEVDDELLQRLNELADRAVEALERVDETSLGQALEEMGALVRERGRRRPDDALATTEAIIPPSDLTLEETCKLLRAGPSPRPTRGRCRGGPCPAPRPPPLAQRGRCSSTCGFR